MRDVPDAVCAEETSVPRGSRTLSCFVEEAGGLLVLCRVEIISVPGLTDVPGLHSSRSTTSSTNTPP